QFALVCIAPGPFGKTWSLPGMITLTEESVTPAAVTLLGAGSAAMTMRPSPASPIAPSNVLRIAVMANLQHGSRNFGDQVTVSVVVSIELRMKPPGFQIGV